MRRSSSHYESEQSGGLIYRLIDGFMKHPLRLLIAKAGLPLGLIFGSFAALNYWLLTDIEGTYNGSGAGMGAAQMLLQKDGDSLSGRLTLPNGEQFSVYNGRFNDGKVELAFAPIEQAKNSSLDNNLIFVGTASGEELQGVLSRGTEEQKIRFRRSAITVLFQRLVAWR